MYRSLNPDRDLEKGSCDCQCLTGDVMSVPVLPCSQLNAEVDLFECEYRLGLSSCSLR